MLILSRLIEIVLDDNATYSELLLVVLSIAVLWAVIFTVLCALIRPLVYNKPWLVAAGERDYERGGREMYETLGLKKTKSEFVETFMNMWPWTICVIAQHLVGGGLCLPSLLGIGDPQVAASLACLGILSEAGWEIEDILSWTYKRFGLPDGKAQVPSALLILLSIHHSLTTVLGLPTILSYRDFSTLHLLCFELQFAAVTALAITEYTKLLDVSKPNQLFQFQILTFFAFVVMVWTRGIHWLYLCGKFVIQWYHDKAWGFLVFGTLFAVLFSIFNYVFCIQSYYVRLRKFLKVSAEYKSLPTDASPQQRRASVLELERAAGSVIGHHQLEEELAAMFATSNGSSRRSTLPPSMFGSGKSRRRSLVLLRSSAGDMLRVIAQLNSSADGESSMKRD